MDNVLDDARFAHVAKDPRFRRIPKTERKVKIDKRFRPMFNDKKFLLKYTIDKRGRPSNQSSNENLKKYYHLSSNEDEESGSDENVKSTNIENNVRKDVKAKSVTGMNGDRLDHLQNLSDRKSKSKIKRTTKVAHLLGNGELLRTKTQSDSDLVSESENDENEYSKSEDELESISKVTMDFENGADPLQINKSDTGSIPTMIKEKLRDLTVDYARGEGTLLTESSSEEESSDEDDQENEIDHDWGELDREAETTDEITNRLAVCNMDWDRIRAVDLLVLFNSFLPSNGLIHSVTIYPSEFGLQRMKEEEIRGPIELVESKNNTQNFKEDDENEEGTKYHMEKLRQYQLNRLKYYYAVIVCDSPQTANKIYTECDGIEYESTATKLDLRFIPDDTTFDQEPKEVCDKVPELSKYQPRQFVTTALQQVKVELTWDETNPHRQEIAEKLNCGKVDDIDPSDIRAYLGSGSSSEDDSDENESKNNSDERDLESDNDADPIAKYKSLLHGIEEQQEKNKNKGIEMEITWGLGSKAKSEKLVAEKMKKKEELTPFEQYLEKRKAKKKSKMAERKKLRESNENASDSDNSEDSVPSDIDMDDPYFAEEFKNMKPKLKKSSKNQIVNDINDVDKKQQEAELELLLMDKTEDAGRKHFDMKKIEDNESLSKSKRKRQKKMNKYSNKDETVDDFKVNVCDQRFEALYSSHHYNIDPADPRYRKTKGTEALIEEKLKRRTDGKLDQDPEKKIKTDKKLNAELNALVKSVKRKSQNISQRIKY
ncbi:ESF1 homolog [Neodiprion fabricii]|uniref:ESF1 homolog n=1 Tax=Neodiprion fabricii TaxID=2872261 RepID=UPI001ED9088E|nr:ESF1 homolog [Neodiprion fabricii]